MNKSLHSLSLLLWFLVQALDFLLQSHCLQTLLYPVITLVSFPVFIMDPVSSPSHICFSTLPFIYLSFHSCSLSLELQLLLFPRFTVAASSLSVTIFSHSIPVSLVSHPKSPNLSISPPRKILKKFLPFLSKSQIIAHASSQ